MTPTEEAETIREQYASGHSYGIDIANVINEQFPPGPRRSTRYVRRKLRQIINESFSTPQRIFLVHGTESRFRQPFADGFIIGLKERDPELSAYLDTKVSSLG